MDVKILHKTLSACIKRYKWIQITVGIVGNLFWLVGSILFLQDIDSAGWFFLIGTTGMLINSIGNLIAETESNGTTALTDIGCRVRLHQHNEKRQHPYHQKYS